MDFCLKLFLVHGSEEARFDGRMNSFLVHIGVLLPSKLIISTSPNYLQTFIFKIFKYFRSLRSPYENSLLTYANDIKFDFR